jgi:hypothetical protein
MADAKKLLAESGYGGTPVVIMEPDDVVTLKAEPIVAAPLLLGAERQRSSAMTERRLVSTKYHPQIPSGQDERIEATPQSRPMSRDLRGLVDRLFAIVRDIDGEKSPFPSGGSG